jgi:hypothetical protein
VIFGRDKAGWGEVVGNPITEVITAPRSPGRTHMSSAICCGTGTNRMAWHSAIAAICRLEYALTRTSDVATLRLLGLPR